VVPDRILMTLSHRISPPDETWTPASRTLVSELPSLMRTMHDGGFDIYRVMYNPNDWDETPRRAVIEHRTIKMGWYSTQDRGVITVVDGTGRNRVRVVNGS
jgi:hypothetical protein